MHICGHRNGDFTMGGSVFHVGLSKLRDVMSKFTWQTASFWFWMVQAILDYLLWTMWHEQKPSPQPQSCPFNPRGPLCGTGIDIALRWPQSISEQKFFLNMHSRFLLWCAQAYGFKLFKLWTLLVLETEVSDWWSFFPMMNVNHLDTASFWEHAMI